MRTYDTYQDARGHGVVRLCLPEMSDGPVFVSLDCVSPDGACEIALSAQDARFLGEALLELARVNGV
jgi:hypothetical protein